jgi:splicing suppressor protein 51
MNLPYLENSIVIPSRAQAYCATCRRTAVQLSNRSTALKRCPSCRLVSSCTDCSADPTTTHSPSICESYKNFAAIENFRIGFFEDTGKASPITCTQFPRKTRKLLADAAGWFEYYANISDKQQIAGIVKPDFSGVTGTSKAEKEEQERMRMFLLCATDNLTMPLTIVSALEDISFEKPHLNIHLVGATGRELVAMGNFEEINHLVPAIRSLHITAVGPGLMAGEGGSPYIPKTKVECCPGCKADRRTRSIAVFQGLYHDFAERSEFEKPDLVVLFNSGWADGDDAESDWAPSIKYLIKANVPALFTTYNAQEAGHEERKLKDLGAKFSVPVGENKWKGLMPTPEFIDDEYGKSNPVFPWTIFLERDVCHSL